MSKVQSKAGPSRLEQSVPLLRQLGVASAMALVISNMVGTGIFTTSGFLAGDLGSPKLVLCIWLAGAAVALAGALCYSELGINFPSSGGEYVYLTRAYGPTWGFMTGWCSFFAGFSAPIAAAALAFSDYLGHFFPALKESSTVYTIGSGAFSLRLGGAQAAASALILVFTLLNCFGLRRVANIQNVLTATKILVVLAFIGLGFLAGTGSWQNFSAPAVRTSTTPLAWQFVVSLFWVMFGYSGWNAATYVAEEIKRPERTLPIALATGTVLVAALYMGLNMVFIYATPLESMKGVVAVGALAASHLFGPGVAGMFSALMALSLVATVNAMVVIGPRVYYAMAKNKAFFPAAAKVHSRWHTPFAAILAQGACAILMTLTPFRELVKYIAFSLTFFTVMSVSSLFIFRHRSDWQKLRVVSFLFPLLPSFFIVVNVCMIVVGLKLWPIPSLIATAVIVAGAGVYHFWIKSNVANS